jgi:hypothetical protein
MVVFAKRFWIGPERMDRVMVSCVRLGQRSKSSRNGLDEESHISTERAARLGKVGVSDNALRRPTELSHSSISSELKVSAETIFSGPTPAVRG